MRKYQFTVPEVPAFASFDYFVKAKERLDRARRELGQAKETLSELAAHPPASADHRAMGQAFLDSGNVDSALSVRADHAKQGREQTERVRVLEEAVKIAMREHREAHSRASKEILKQIEPQWTALMKEFLTRLKATAEIEENAWQVLDALHAAGVAYEPPTPTLGPPGNAARFAGLGQLSEADSPINQLLRRAAADGLTA